MIPEVRKRQSEIEAICRRHGVRRLDIFGSAASGDFRSDDSDLDFLVEFESPDAPGYSDRYFGVLEDLAELFGRSVDLVVDSAITNPYFRASVERTRTHLYAA